LQYVNYDKAEKEKGCLKKKRERGGGGTAEESWFYVVAKKQEYERNESLQKQWERTVHNL